MKPANHLARARANGKKRPIVDELDNLKPDTIQLLGNLGFSDLVIRGTLDADYRTSTLSENERAAMGDAGIVLTSDDRKKLLAIHGVIGHTPVIRALARIGNSADPRDELKQLAQNEVGKRDLLALLNVNAPDHLPDVAIDIGVEGSAKNPARNLREYLGKYRVAIYGALAIAACKGLEDATAQTAALNALEALVIGFQKTDYLRPAGAKTGYTSP